MNAAAERSDRCFDAARALAPAIAQQAGKYRLRLAGSNADMRAICRLRFEVFNLELDEGLEASFETGLDEDRFDAQCHHLLVEDEHGTVVGTYRMQDSAMARSGFGFYSAAEFELQQLPANVLDQSVELGRACIHADHRNTRVLFLLWRGLAAYMVAGGHRYFFGCCSLTSQDPLEGQRLFERLQAEGAVDRELMVDVTAQFRCETQSPATKDAQQPPRVPKLMRLYLAYGARIISPPALDREFSTIDYLALFDIESLSDANRRMFLDHE